MEVLLKGFDARISNRELNDASKVSFHLLTKQDVLQDLNLARKLMTNFLHTCIAIIINMEISLKRSEFICPTP